MAEDSEFPKGIGEFIEQEYEKFAIMGIFGTVSVFLISNFPGGTNRFVARAGAVASLLIFLLVTVWLFLRTAGLLFDSTPNMPLSTKLGYLVLTICTGTLGVAIGSSMQVDSYHFATILIGQIIIATGVLLSYSHVFPSNRYPKDVYFSFGLGLATILFLNLLDEIIYLIEGTTQNSFLLAGFAPLFFAAYHVLFSEAFFGIGMIHESVTKDRDSFQSVNSQKLGEVVKQGCPNQVSILLMVVSFGALSLYLAHEASQYSGFGDFWLLGKHWMDWLVRSWSIISALVVISVWDDETKRRNRLIKPFHLQIISILIAISSIALVSLLYFGYLGTRFVDFPL